MLTGMNEPIAGVVAITLADMQVWYRDSAIPAKDQLVLTGHPRGDTTSAGNGPTYRTNNHGCNKQHQHSAARAAEKLWHVVGSTLQPCPTPNSTKSHITTPPQQAGFCCPTRQQGHVSLLARLTYAPPPHGLQMPKTLFAHRWKSEGQGFAAVAGELTGSPNRMDEHLG